jgi:pyridoxal phosphate enzyme (YggS family)
MTSRQEELSTNLHEVQEEIASYKSTLIVVTKTYPVSDVEILYGLGVRDFGENRSDEGLTKSSSVSARWHYQGEIQSKKLREILDWASCIHSLDQPKHGEKIERLLEESGETTEVFLQLSLDGDPERGGVVESEVFTLAERFHSSRSIKVMGLMSVPPVEMDRAEAFSAISQVHHRFKAAFPEAPFLSAGMSGDYLIALDHGATHIRVGSKILGPRQYR